MYFCTYQYQTEVQVGLLTSDKQSVIPISELINQPISGMLSLIQVAEKLLPQIQQALTKDKGRVILPLSDVKLLAPIPYPARDIICLGKNYAAHAQELSGSIFQDSDLPQYPIYFSKRAAPAIGHGDTIKQYPKVTNQVDYEVELAVVIGKTCSQVAPAEVGEYIFGYTIVNDISARDIQNQHKQWYRGKSLDTYCPMGPWIALASTISFPPELAISSKVNGEIRQQDNTNNMIFDITHVISELSQAMTLVPGDIIITGTPAGVGMGFKPPKFLQSGDLVECEIEGIGILSNRLE